MGEIGFWRWLWRTLKGLPKRFLEGIRKDPLNEALLGLFIFWVFAVLGSLVVGDVMIKKTLWVLLWIPAVVGTLMVLHGFYREEMERK